jgi:hypothetical protein
MREMCGERGIDTTKLKSRAMMAVAIIEHEETLVVMYTVPEVGSVPVTPKKDKECVEYGGVRTVGWSCLHSRTDGTGETLDWGV